MTKYSIPDDHWKDDEPEGPPAWKEDTSAKSIEIDVQLHDQGYQTDEKWTVHCSDRIEDDDTITAVYAIKHQNKGNYWREGERWRDAVDFVDLPLRVCQRVAAVLNRDLAEITPDHRTIHREDGTGVGDDPDDDQDVECVICGDEVPSDAIVQHHTSEHPNERYDPLWYQDGDSDE